MWSSLAGVNKYVRYKQKHKYKNDQFNVKVLYSKMFELFMITKRPQCNFKFMNKIGE